jgi:hypothetical protein
VELQIHLPNSLRVSHREMRLARLLLTGQALRNSYPLADKRRHLYRIPHFLAHFHFYLFPRFAVSCQFYSDWIDVLPQTYCLFILADRPRSPSGQVGHTFIRIHFIKPTDITPCT